MYIDILIHLFTVYKPLYDALRSLVGFNAILYFVNFMHMMNHISCT